MKKTKETSPKRKGNISENGSGKIFKGILDAVLAVAITYLSLIFFQLLMAGITGMPAEALSVAVQYFIFVFLWVIVVGFCLLHKNRPILQAIGSKMPGNNWKNLLLGLAIGFGMNAGCVLLALLHKDISLHFVRFEPFCFVVIFLAVFIQSSSEEMLCRVFLYQRLIKNWHPAIAIVGNGLLFSLLHLSNEGMTFLAGLNIIIVGVLFSLMVYYMDSVWCAMAAHAAWNFTQNIIFGLPNSGSPSAYSVFGLDASAAKNSFAYDVGFGIEGTWCSTAVILLVIVCIWLWGSKTGRKPSDIWLMAERRRAK